MAYLLERDQEFKRKEQAAPHFVPDIRVAQIDRPSERVRAHPVHIYQPPAQQIPSIRAQFEEEKKETKKEALISFLARKKMKNFTKNSRRRSIYKMQSDQLHNQSKLSEN
jgi:hypothetical protein